MYMNMKAREQLKEFTRLMMVLTDVYNLTGFSTDEKLLYYLIEQEEMNTDATQSNFCGSWMINAQTASSAVRRMEKLGYLTLSYAEDDRRRRLLHLTDEGRKKAYACVLPVRKAEISVFEKMSDEKTEQILSLFNDLAENYKEEFLKIKY